MERSAFTLEAYLEGKVQANQFLHACIGGAACERDADAKSLANFLEVVVFAREGEARDGGQLAAFGGVAHGTRSINQGSAAALPFLLPRNLKIAHLA
jgi:hypothetical protein